MNKALQHTLKLAGVLTEGLDFSQENSERQADLESALARVHGEEAVKMLYKLASTKEITEDEFAHLFRCVKP